MDAANPATTDTHTPVAVVWCRQVDNEAESPGYTTIPDEFPGRRETLETIRVVGNLTVNVADTHDYWDPDPSQPLSYYPNLFLYPAGGGRYTCVGRMFLSTEDRPRIGMKTLVFDTAALVRSGEFGAAVLRAHATMGGRTGPARPGAEPDSQVYQGVGEGFLFHRGSTEPVILVAAEQWEAVNQVALELVRTLPTSLVALGAFLVFPYFLPVAKVDMHQFTEQLPLALAVMRVPRAEAQGDRHAKRLQGWEAAPISLRDLTKPASGRGKDTLPLVLQYTRDHTDDKLAEVSRRVDLVEGPRLPAVLNDAERQSGRDRRKEMWRIGTAMETAALLISRPRGRAITLSGETGRRASEYVKARSEAEASAVGAAGASARPGEAFSESTPTPPWLQRPPDIALPSSDSVGVPVSVQTDPSLFPSSPPTIPPPVHPASTAPTRTPTDLDSRTPPVPPPPRDALALDLRIASAVRSAEATWRANLEARFGEATEVQARALAQLGEDLAKRLVSLESRPAPVTLDQAATEVERRLRTNPDPRFAELSDKTQQTVKAVGEVWASSLRQELKQWAEELTARSAHMEEELRTALVAQLELEVSEAKEQNSALREQIEARVRTLVDGRAIELDQRRARDVRELEQRLGLLVDGRAKDLEQKFGGLADARNQESEHRLASQIEATRAQLEDRVAQTSKRLEVDREARLSEINDTTTKSLAGLQVRIQAYLEQRIREDQDRERGKYVELLARLKGEVDEALARTIDSTRFDSAVRERVTRGVAEAKADQAKGLAELEGRLRASQAPALARVEGVEVKLRERESDLAKTEQKIHQDVEDLDRRIQVMSDRMLPLVRQTWERIDEMEKKAASNAGEARYAELRREVARELRRVETELRDDAAELRDRLETTVTSQGKIWLNLVRQISEVSAGYLPSEDDARRASARRATRRSPPTEDADLGRPRGREAPFASFADDPVNPLDPALPPDEPPPARRPPNRSGRGGGGQG